MKNKLKVEGRTHSKKRTKKSGDYANKMKKLFLLSLLILGLNPLVQAQEKTKEELNAEREVIKSELKSKQAEERKVKFEKLESPKTSGVSSVDQLATDAATILLSTKSINQQIPELYKRTLGETVDGVTDVTVKKPTVEELAAVALTITNQISAIAKASSAVSTSLADIKSASLMQASKATKSLNFSKDALSLTGPELQLSLKVINNLIAQLKSANNN